MDNLTEKYIPLDKSWIIRMGVLDLLDNSDNCIRFLQGQERLSDDLNALLKASLDWKSKKVINVGESGTLYRFLQFASWKLDLHKKFALEGTLKKRKICENQEIVHWPLRKLLGLDNGTSQWASAAVLLGNRERITDAPYKLKITYEAVEHWEKQKEKSECWLPRYDETILKQAGAFLELIKNEKTNFKPEQAEDYCFSRAFNLITKEEGESRWPSLRSHESDRITEMEKELENFKSGKEIQSKDHRVVQALALLQKFKGKPIRVKHPDSVNKSWPKFWDFLKSI